ncbi:MAG TPA: HAMP domain-containing sensor histidine kinase [Kofleriaceae bacterium]|nr:HAMP domain-containing sensor histidine kinase [Kofleriaceae bacterium]
MTRERRSLARRVVLTTLASGMFGAIVALVIAGRVVGDALGAQLAPLLASRFDAEAARACRDAPARWSLPLWPAWGMRGYAYDARTGAAYNPDAPPLRGDLVGRLGGEPLASVIDLRARDHTGALVFRTGAPAPCDLIQLVWRNPSADRRVGRIWGASAVASALFASGIALLVLVAPMVRRIGRLRAAASRVGEPDGYVALGRDGRPGDELDGLGQVLDRAHLRIRSDAALLEDQRAALERHLARIAHDLRTPLTSLQIALEFAVDRIADPAARDAIASALRDAVYLSGLTYNLRLASRLRSGWNPADDVSDVDLVVMVERIVGRARMLARRRQIELALSVPDEPLGVRCSALAVEQALTNIVDNAVAYGDPQGHVAVVLSARGDGFELEVSDDGPGVPPASLPQLGQATFRSDDARQRDPRGNGLGLAITAEVCGRIGWSLEFAALEPRGLQVRIGGPGGKERTGSRR